MSRTIRYIILSVGSSIILVGFVYLAHRMGADLSMRLIDLTSDHTGITLVFLGFMILEIAMSLSILLIGASRNAARLKRDIAKLIEASLRAAEKAAAIKAADRHARTTS